MVYDISHKTLAVPRPLLTRFDKINGFIRIYEGSKYLELLCPEKYDAIFSIELETL